MGNVRIIRPRTFEDAAAKYVEEARHRSLKRDIHALRLVLPYIGHLPIDDVDNEALAPYKRDRLAGHAPPPPLGKVPKPMLPGTVNRDLATVIRILNLAARLWRWIPAAPLIQQVDGPRKKPYPLKWNEQRDLFYFLPKHLRAAALFKVNTGLRESELCTLTWSMEVEIPELETTAFILTKTKNGEERLVVLNRIAREVLAAQRDKHESAVFTYARKPLKGMENTAWRRAWRDAELPVDPLTLSGVHNLRHTFGHRLRAAGISIEDRKALLGHKSREITTHYSVPDIARLIECVERITTERETVILRPVRNVA